LDFVTVFSDETFFVVSLSFVAPAYRFDKVNLYRLRQNRFSQFSSV
jgi:hypothetical protein